MSDFFANLSYRIMSWIFKYPPIGHKKYIKASPFVVGEMGYYLPESLRYQVREYEWTREGWFLKQELRLTAEQLRVLISVGDSHGQPRN